MSRETGVKYIIPKIWPIQIEPPYPKYEYFRRTPRAGIGEEACVCIDLSILAYESADFISDVLLHKRPLGIELIRIVDIGAFQAIVADWNGRRIVAFRGTCNIRGWVTDCDCAMTKEGIHKGFDYAINVMAKELQPLVSGKDMLGTGHSLGGAMGTLAPRTLISKEAKTISFGAPRSADREAAIKIVLKNNTRPPERYVHGCDIVPDVPLNAMDYAHGDAPINLKQVPRPLCDFFVPMEFYSHVPTLYAERIWQINEECGVKP